MSQILSGQYRIKQHMFQVPFKNNKGEISAEFLPVHFNLSDGVWESRLDSITVKWKKGPTPIEYNTVLTVRANLSENYEQKQQKIQEVVETKQFCPGLASFVNCSGFVTVPTCFFIFELNLNNKKFCFVRNPSLDWFMVEAKPYNHYKVFIDEVPGFDRLPNFEADFILDWRFRRMM